MPLEEGQASVNGLVLGRGTPYKLNGFNPWARENRHDQQALAWAAGAWSGREDTDAVVVPMVIRTFGTSAASWQALHRQLCAAFRASNRDVELRYRLAGDVEYVMHGRPRMVDPTIEQIGTGIVLTQAAFVALDPLQYSAAEESVPIPLPSITGGLTFPITFPITFSATVIAGSAQLTNLGTADTGLKLRIDGPAPNPRVSLTEIADPTNVRSFRLSMTVEAGQWLDIDTARHTVDLNGVVSRRGYFAGDWILLPPGTHELAWNADAYDPAALLTPTWRHAWT